MGSKNRLQDVAHAKSIMCFSPYHQRDTGLCFPCGQCLACTIKRRREWVSRLYLEFCVNDKAIYVTLTYDEDNIPVDRCLDKRHLQLFFKRLRKSLPQRRIRYYACGEYGEKTKRPHYHAIIYGISYYEAPLSELVEYFKRVWKLGGVYLGYVSHDSISYVAGYVTKKQADRRDDSVVPEFSVMSRRPAIGAPAIPYIVETLKKIGGNDLPPYIRIGGKKYVIPKYLRNKLYEILYDPEYVEALKQNKLEQLHEATKELVIKHFGEVDYLLKKNYREAHSLEYKQKRLNYEAKKIASRVCSTF